MTQQGGAPAEVEALDKDPTEGTGSADVSRPELAPFDPAPQREWTRTILATLVVATVPVTVAAACIGWLFLGIKAAEIKDVAIALVGTVGGLAGAVVGFYFGERRRGGRA